MKLINLKQEYIKVSGIYRIWIDYNGQEVSYVGQSKNINTRLKFHFREIKRAILKELILVNSKISKSKTIASIKADLHFPAKGAFYYKVYLLKNMLKQNDNDFLNSINCEVLETCSNQTSSFQLEEKEIKFIQSYDSIWRGLNGYHAIHFKLSHWLDAQGHNDEIKFLQTINQKMHDKLDLRKDLPFLWLYFNLGNFAKFWAELMLLFPDLKMSDIGDLKRRRNISLSK